MLVRLNIRLLAIIGIITLLTVSFIILRNDNIRNQTIIIKRPAVFTQFYSNDYFQGVLTLAYSVKLRHPEIDFNIMYFEDKVDPKKVTQLASLGYRIRSVKRVKPVVDPMFFRFLDQYTKLHIWSYEEYSRVVYIDADCLVVGDISAMLDLPQSITFAAIGDVYDTELGFVKEFNAGVMSVVPNNSTLTKLLETRSHTDKFNTGQAEQAMLNYYYSHSFTRLEYIYNLNLALFSKRKDLRSVWNKLRPDARVIHYTLGKPFLNINAFYNETAIPWYELNKEANEQLDRLK